MAKTIADLILEFFKSYPNTEFRHAEVKKWVEERYGREPQDVPRAVRKHHEKGILVQVRKGVYKYDPALENQVDLMPFPPNTRQAIFQRDNYRCVYCGKGRSDGIEIVADHIKPMSKGGTPTLENGQTLCTQHNTLKKTYSQTEAGKRYFIRMYNIALENGDGRIVAFCESVFDAYDKHEINGHIERPDLS